MGINPLTIDADEPARLRVELDRQTAGRRTAQEQVDDLAQEVRHLNWRINQLRSGYNAIRSGSCDPARVAVEALANDGHPPTQPATVEQVATAASTLREALEYRESAAREIAEADAWCEYWRREADADRSRATDLEQRLHRLTGGDR